MSEDTVCKQNQRGFCKFKLLCRKRHENALCPEDATCISKECVFRHPKVCKNYSKEGICRFKEFCAYKHEKDTNQNNSVKHLITNHEKEISTIKHELNQILHFDQILFSLTYARY